MVLLTVLLHLLIPSQVYAAQADSCKSSLKKILTAAEVKVNQTYKKGDPCGVGALKGQNATKGCSGNFELMGLKMALAPYYYDAKDVCKSTCDKEGKRAACENLITTDYMVSKGIQGLQGSVSKISYSPESELNFEDFSSYKEWLEAVYNAAQGHKEVVTISI